VSRINGLLQVAKTLGREPRQLADRPRLRNELMPFWKLFVDLKNASDGRIGYVQINAYGEIYGKLTVFEVDIIRSLDDLQAAMND
jgi:hypothetical protein